MFRPHAGSYRIARALSVKNEPNGGSFADVLNKMKGNYSESGEKVEEKAEADKEQQAEASQSSESHDSAKKTDTSVDYIALAYKYLQSGRDASSNFVSEVKGAWNEMISGDKESKVRKKVAQASSFKAKKSSDDDEEEEEEAAYDGPSALVVSKTNKSTWEQMYARLEDSPLIKEMLKNTKRFSRQAANTDIGKQASKIGEDVTNKIHDAREFWETTQNPLVYKISGAWESMTAPTEEGMAVAEIQKLDPYFIKEQWAEEIKRDVAPAIIKAHLEGDLKTLKPLLGEAVYNKLAADIRTRKSDGISIDTNVLDIDEAQILIRYLEHEGPIVLVVYMVQQINCIRNRAGEIIEGGESDVVAKIYTLAFKQVYNEDEGLSDWKVVDYDLSPGETYY